MFVCQLSVGVNWEGFQQSDQDRHDLIKAICSSPIYLNDGKCAVTMGQMRTCMPFWTIVAMLLSLIVCSFLPRSIVALISRSVASNRPFVSAGGSGCHINEHRIRFGARTNDDAVDVSTNKKHRHGTDGSDGGRARVSSKDAVDTHNKMEED